MTDPFASIAVPHQVAQSAAATDPFASIAQQPAASTPPPAASGKIPSEEAADQYLKSMSWWNPAKYAAAIGAGPLDVLQGVGTGIDKTVSGAGKLIRKATGGQEGSAMQTVDSAAHTPGSTDPGARFNRGVGEMGENMGEFFSGEELLNLLGKAGSVLTAGQKLQKAQALAKTISEVPYIGKLLHIGLNAVKAGGIGGAQELMKTGGDTDAAKTAALETAAGSGVLEGGMNAIGTIAKKVAPKVVEIAGEKIPALASQVSKEGKLTGEPAADATRIAQAQQQGGANVVRNVSQGAAAKALDEINATRATAARAPAGAPQLPAPEGSTPFSFELNAGRDPIEGRTEMSVQPAEKFEPAASRVPEGKEPGPQNKEELGSEASTIPDRMQKRTQAYTSETGEPAADEARGGGKMQTTDPHEAERWRYGLQDLMESKQFDELPAEKQTAIREAHDQLEHQLGMYYSSPYASRFAAVDTPAAISQVRSFGEAANQIRSAAAPVYETLDQVSGGEFNKWKLQARNANKVIKNASSADAVEAAQGKLQEANQAIDELITRHASSIGPADYRAAKLAWNRSSTLENLHSVMERMANGITLGESERAGLPRVITGNAKMMESWLSKGNNRASVENLIGRDGVDNLKRMSVLLGQASSARSTQTVLREVAQQFHRHVREGALLGGLAGQAMGGHWGTGAAVGAGAGAAVYTAQQILRYAATNPEVGKLVDYAVTHNVQPQIYAPLIARSISSGFEQVTAEPEGQEEEEQQP